MKVTFIPRNEADAMTLAASPAMETALPVGNLKLPGRSFVARSTDVDVAQVITATRADSVRMSAVVLHRHNLTSEATWRVEVFSGAVGTGLVYDSGTVAAVPSTLFGELDFGLTPLGDGWRYDHDTPLSAMAWFDSVLARSVRITITDTNNPDGYIEAARLIAGRAVTLADNPDYGFELAWVDPSVTTRTADGGQRVSARAPYRTLTLPFTGIGLADRSALVDMARTVGRRGEVFVSLLPTDGSRIERDCAFLANIPGSASRGIEAGLFADTLTLEEL